MRQEDKPKKKSKKRKTLLAGSFKDDIFDGSSIYKPALNSGVLTQYLRAMTEAKAIEIFHLPANKLIQISALLAIEGVDTILCIGCS